MRMRATRHNGRAGKNGVYNPKHNERDFDVENSDHIDEERTGTNICWDYVEAQNERNEKARHPERNRNIEDVLTNLKTCPEETLLQLGNIDKSVSPATLYKIAAEYFEEFKKGYGERIHILSWALHLDETTPHIHERHVFDAVNKYEELVPWQDKALEELGIPLPDPDKPKMYR